MIKLNFFKLYLFFIRNKKDMFLKFLNFINFFKKFLYFFFFLVIFMSFKNGIIRFLKEGIILY